MNKVDKDLIVHRYQERLAKYGENIKALASGVAERQLVRFKVLSEVGDLNHHSVLDLGCGFADFYAYLKEMGIKADYTGYDICPDFIELCKKRFPEAQFEVKDIQTEPAARKFDYVISSQAFNNRLVNEDNETVVRDIIKRTYEMSNMGVAIDLLSSYVDFREERLHYYSPEDIFKFCKTLTKRVTLRHDYPLFEFTICLYKDFEGVGTKADFSKPGFMSESTFFVATTVDADGDFFDVSLNSGGPSKGVQWRGVEEGIPLLVESLRKYEDSFGSPLRFTWFVRVDNQLKETCGHATYLLKRYRPVWLGFREKRDEIAWHPHLYQKAGERWVQETRPAQLVEDLTQSHRAMTEEGFPPVSSRIGEAFHSNVVMSQLASLGVKVDSTAMPGRVRMDEERSIDWQGTPPRPYYPSRADYRTPGSGDSRVGILEVPFSMIKTRVEYDKEPLMRYVDLSFHNSVMKAGLRAYIKDNDYLVSVTHPSTVLPHPNQRHPLVSFAIGEAERNLDAILSECVRAGKKAKFVTVSEFLDIKGLANE